MKVDSYIKLPTKLLIVISTFFIALCLLRSTDVFAQSSIHSKHNFFLGALPHTLGSIRTTPDWDKKKYHMFGVNTKLGYFLTNHIAIGASLRWNIVRSNFTSRRPAIGPGIFGRYYFGFINNRLNELTRTVTILGQEQPIQMSFYAELDYAITNEAVTRKSNKYFVTKRINNHYVSPAIGYNISFIRNFYFNAALKGTLFFPKQDLPEKKAKNIFWSNKPYGMEIGIYYYFLRNPHSPQKPPQVISMANHFGKSVKKLFQKTDTFHSNDIIIGAAGTFLPFVNRTVPKEVTDSSNYFMHEGTWTLNIGYDLNKFFRAGLKSMTIFTKSSYTGRRNFWRGGPYLQFDFLGKKRGRLFLESGVYYGNYCTCGDYEPYRKKGLTRLSVGAGGSIPLGKNFYVDLSILSFPILGEVERKLADGKYNIGISYRFDI
jgi:hypothetical protein